VIDLTPRGIREHLGLNRPIYARTSAYVSAVRRSPTAVFPGECTDLVGELRHNAN
jgi:S-adenosylmethionine synthetase